VKTLLICFSQTGNTKKIADCIKEGVLDVLPDCDMCDMEQAGQADLEDCDLVGMGCPVFYYQEPFNVRQFLEGLPDLQGKKWFLFCTHGSIIGNTFFSMTDILRRKGVDVIGYHDTYADAWLPFYPHPTYTTGHPDGQEFEAARSFGKEIVQRCMDLNAGKAAAQARLAPIPEEWSKNAEMFTPENMAKMFPHLRLDKDACEQCLTCEQNCPVNGIDIMADEPRLQEPCVYCWRCVNICPEGAILADWDPLVKMAPKLYERYRFWLDRAAEEGRFRWRVDPDSIDFEKPYYLKN